MKKLLLLLVFSFYFLVFPVSAQTVDTIPDTIPTHPIAPVNPGAPHQPRVGLVLGGGGAKGAAHIGVLKYMEEIGIPISYVTGTSMGSIIGGLYALGYTPDELAHLIAHMDWNLYMSNKIERDDLSIEQRERKGTEILSIPFSIGDVRAKRSDLIGSLPSGAVNSSNLLNLFNRLCIGYQDSMDFRDLPIPFACIATDLLTGDSVILNHGEFGRAIRSSMSIPGVFAPVEWRGRLLADGGMVNNFPADVCRDMGADILIGVEVGSQPITDIDSLRSLPQQVMQYLSIATQGHNIENRKLCRLYITPDVTGYNMLSFSTDNIDSLVQRGYRQAQLHEAEFLALKRELEKYGPCQKELQGPHASKLMPGDRIQVGEIAYHGVPPEETRRLLSLHYLESGVEIDVNGLEEAVSRLRGSGNYLYAHYILHLVDSNRYNVDFYLDPAKPHTLGLGFHYDSEESAAVLIHLGLNEQRTSGFKAFFDLDLAYNFGLGTRLSYSKRGSGEINFDYRYHKSAYRILNWSTMKSIWHNRFRIYYSNRSFNHLTILAGIQQDFFIDANTRISSRLIDPDVFEIYDSENAFSIFADVSYDNMDDKYYANHGMELNANAAVYKDNQNLFNLQSMPFAAARVTWRTHIPLGERFTLIPNVAGRGLLNYINVQDPIWYYSTIGGAFDGRYHDQQIAFFGFNDIYAPTTSNTNVITVERLDLRYKLTEKDYISLIGNLCTSFYTNYNEDLSPYLVTRNIFGAGVRLAHKSIFGPIWLDIAWNSLNHRFSGFLNVGYFF